MMIKGLKIKWRNEKSIVWEMLLPVLYGYILKMVSESFECVDCKESDIEMIIIVKSVIMPFLMALYIPQISALNARFIMQSMVMEKSTKIRESLKLMSLTSRSYVMSYVYLNGIISVIQGIIIIAWVFGNEAFFLTDVTSRSIQLMIVVILLLLA